MNYFVNNIKLNMIACELVGIYHDICVKLKIPDCAMVVLYVIRIEGEGCTQSDISRFSGISRKTINSAVWKMIYKGVLSAKKIDGKNIGIFLTESGEKLARKTADIIINIEKSINSSLTEEEIAIYLKLHGKLINELKQKADSIITQLVEDSTRHIKRCKLQKEI